MYDRSKINKLYRNDEFLLEIDSSHESKKVYLENMMNIPWFVMVYDFDNTALLLISL